MTPLTRIHPKTGNSRPATCLSPPEPARLNRDYRQRDIGVGYGNSSGYASDRQYARSWGQPRFRFR